MLYLLAKVKAYNLANPQGHRLCDVGHYNVLTQLTVDAIVAFMHEF